MNGVAVDGVCRRRTQVPVPEGTLTEVEHHKDAAEMQVPGGELITVTLLEAFDIDVGDVIDQVDLPGTQGRQAYRVLSLGLADDLIEIWQGMACGVGLPVVLEAHQPGLLPARPGDKLEWARANRMVCRSVKGVGGLQVGGIMQQVGR